MRKLSFAITVFLILGFFGISLQVVHGQQSADELRDPEQIFVYARGLMSRGFYDLALPQLENFQREFSTHERARDVDLQVIYCLRELKRDPQAIAEIQKYQTRWKKIPDQLRLQLRGIEAECNYRIGNYAASETCYREVADQSEGLLQEKAMYCLAQCLLKEQRAPEALAILSRLAEKPLDSDNTYRIFAAYTVAQDYIRNSKISDATALLSRLLDCPRLQDAMKSELMLQLAHLYFNERDYAKATYWYEHFNTAFPNSPRVAVSAKQIILCKFFMDDYAAAFTLCDNWHSKYPARQDTELEYYQALSAMKIQNYERALPLWQSLMNHAENDETLRNESVLQSLDCLHRLNRNQDYLNLANDYVEKNPNSPNRNNVLFEMGRLLYLGNDFNAAIKKLEEAQNGFAGEPENYFIAGELLASCHATLHQWKQAAAVYRKMAAFGQCPTPAKFHNIAAGYLMQLPPPETEEANSQQTAEAETEAAEKKPSLRQDVLDEFNAARRCGGEPEERLKALQQLVLMYIGIKDYDTTLALLPELIQEAPLSECRTWQYLKAQILADYRKNYEAALAETTTLLSTSFKLTDSETYTYANLHAWLLVRLEKYDAIPPVVEQMLKAMKGIPENTINYEALDFLGTSLKNTEYNSTEIAVWRAMIGASGNLSPALRQHAICSLAERLLQMNAVDDALALLAPYSNEQEKQTGIAPRPVLSLLAEVYLAQKDYQKANIFAGRTLSNEPDTAPIDELSQARAHYIKAFVLANADNDYDNALSYALKCYMLPQKPTPYSPKAMKIAILCLEKTGKNEQAAKLQQELDELF